jgi:hypothetical protein
LPPGADPSLSACVDRCVHTRGGISAPQALAALAAVLAEALALAVLALATAPEPAAILVIPAPLKRPLFPLDIHFEFIPD